MNFEVEKFNINGVPIDVVDSGARKLINDVSKSVKNVDKKVDVVAERVEDCFQSVSNGKRLIAEAITDKGVTTSATDTFEVMANNIKKITTTPTIETSDTVNFISDDSIFAQYIVKRGLCISPPSDENGVVDYYVNENEEFYNFPLKIENSVNLYLRKIMYNLNGANIWQEGWAFSQLPNRFIAETYIQFTQLAPTSADTKTVIVTSNSYDFTNAKLVAFKLRVYDLTTSEDVTIKPILSAMVSPTQETEHDSVANKILSGNEIKDGMYFIDVNSVNGYNYVKFALHLKSCICDVKISEINVV